MFLSLLLVLLCFPSRQMLLLLLSPQLNYYYQDKKMHTISKLKINACVFL